MTDQQKKTPIASFAKFWPYYLSEHQNKSSRLLHYFGTLLSNTLLIIIIIKQFWIWIPLVFVVGYGPAWIGHFLIEKNRPATFQYPLWSLLADYKMLYFALAGKLGKELVNASQIKEGPTI